MTGEHGAVDAHFYFMSVLEFMGPNSKEKTWFMDLSSILGETSSLWRCWRFDFFNLKKVR